MQHFYMPVSERKLDRNQRRTEGWLGCHSIDDIDRKHDEQGADNELQRSYHCHGCQPGPSDNDGTDCCNYYCWLWYIFKSHRWITGHDVACLCHDELNPPSSKRRDLGQIGWINHVESDPVWSSAFEGSDTTHTNDPRKTRLKPGQVTSIRRRTIKPPAKHDEQPDYNRDGRSQI